MVSGKATVLNEEGLHMRPAGELAKAVKAHPECKVTLSFGGKTISARSPMMIMAAGIKRGCEVELICEGENEERILNELLDLFAAKFKL